MRLIPPSTLGHDFADEMSSSMGLCHLRPSTFLTLFTKLTWPRYRYSAAVLFQDEVLVDRERAYERVVEQLRSSKEERAGTGNHPGPIHRANPLVRGSMSICRQSHEVQVSRRKP